MIQGVSGSADSFLADVGQIEARLQTDQEQVSSGRKINRPSDDPATITDILQINASLARTTQIGQNLTNVAAEVSGGENAISSAITTLDNVATLAAEGDNFNQTAADRAQLAGQVQGALQNLIADANTSVANRYVFSGDSDQTAPYSLDLTTANGVSAYAGSAATRAVEDPRGGTIAVSQTAQQIFGAPGASVFAAVNQIRLALLNNDQAGLTTAISNLKTAQQHINDSLAFYGTAQNDVTEATSAGKAMELQLQTNLGNLQDADVAQVASDLATAQLNLQAAFQVRAKYPAESLFNFLA